MDVQTGLVYVGIVVLSAAAIAFISMLGIREKSYEEAIAEQRKLPDDLLSSMSTNLCKLACKVKFSQRLALTCVIYNTIALMYKIVWYRI